MVSQLSYRLFKVPLSLVFVVALFSIGFGTTARNVSYHVHSSGGVWKTEDAGQYWIPN